ncbi:TetR family transcriptional regulator [Knoellia sinensis KCTC 19936]|uniref:TetR family transcriptional regulator n=1 Tax=Knoellia sinensis KCTC 19936 TaxID=1385520 RepID=A0A0A0JER7_9MICO|nr:TetR family transcriptional regulator [Knoellia sinensis KCTC 19936]
MDTRELILTEARKSFSENGYAATSLRGIARSAGVDVALVPYYFGNKRDLFVAAVEMPVKPAEAIAHAFAEGPEVAGARLVDTFVGIWEDPATGPAFVAMFRSAMTHDDARQALAEFASKEILGLYARGLGDIDPEEARLRAGLAASQLVGMVMLRHVMRIEPHASLTHEQVVALLGPTVQHYLTGDLGA